MIVDAQGTNTRQLHLSTQTGGLGVIWEIPETATGAVLTLRHAQLTNLLDTPVADLPDLEKCICAMSTDERAWAPMHVIVGRSAESCEIACLRLLNHLNTLRHSH